MKPDDFCSAFTLLRFILHGVKYVRFCSVSLIQIAKHAYSSSGADFCPIRCDRRFTRGIRRLSWRAACLVYPGLCYIDLYSAIRGRIPDVRSGGG